MLVFLVRVAIPGNCLVLGEALAAVSGGYSQHTAGTGHIPSAFCFKMVPENVSYISDLGFCSG